MWPQTTEKLREKGRGKWRSIIIRDCRVFNGILNSNSSVLQRTNTDYIWSMKGISYLTDESSNKKAVVIELSVLQNKPQQVEDLLDVLVAESRKNEPKLDWADVKRNLLAKSK